MIATRPHQLRCAESQAQPPHWYTGWYHMVPLSLGVPCGSLPRFIPVHCFMLRNETKKTKAKRPFRDFKHIVLPNTLPIWKQIHKFHGKCLEVQI